MKTANTDESNLATTTLPSDTEMLNWLLSERFIHKADDYTNVWLAGTNIRYLVGKSQNMQDSDVRDVIAAAMRLGRAL